MSGVKEFGDITNVCVGMLCMKLLMDFQLRSYVIGLAKLANLNLIYTEHMHSP